MRIIELIKPIKYYMYYKRMLLIKRFKSVGFNCQFDTSSDILTPECIELGNNVFIGKSAYISADIKIGNNVMFGPRAIIVGGDHFYAVKGKSIRFMHPIKRENSYPIYVEDEVWFGANIVLLKGVRVGMGAVIGAGSVITKSIPPYTIAVGNPCVPKKIIFDDENLFNHLTLLNYEESIAKEIVRRRLHDLRDSGIENLPIVDKTGTYWETFC